MEWMCCWWTHLQQEFEAESLIGTFRNLTAEQFRRSVSQYLIDGWSCILSCRKIRFQTIWFECMRFQENTFPSPMKLNILVDTEVTNCLGYKSIFGYAWVIIIFVSLGLATWRVCQTQRTCGCTETQRPSLWFRTTLGRVVRGLRSPRDMVSGAVTDRHRLTLLFLTIELLYFSPQNSRWNSYVYEWTRLIYGLNVLCLHFVWFLCKYMCVLRLWPSLFRSPACSWMGLSFSLLALSQLPPFLPWLGVDFLQKLSPVLTALASVPFTPAQVEDHHHQSSQASSHQREALMEHLLFGFHTWLGLLSAARLQ